MIELYGMGSPNVLKIVIMLEELEVPYAYRLVRVLKGENRNPEFLAMNPLGKVPVLIDHAVLGPDRPLYESGAILMYLAETYRPELLPAKGAERWEVLKWLCVQLSLAGPMLGQLNHFQLVPTELESYAGQRYRDQAARVYRDFDTRLSHSKWLGGDEYSIADIAMYPWSGYMTRHGFDLADHPHLAAWRDRVDLRPAVKRALLTVAQQASAEAEASQTATDDDFDRFFARSKVGGPSVDWDSYVQRGAFTSVKIE